MFQILTFRLLWRKEHVRTFSINDGSKLKVLGTVTGQPSNLISASAGLMAVLINIPWGMAIYAQARSMDGGTSQLVSICTSKMFVGAKFWVYFRVIHTKVHLCESRIGVSLAISSSSSSEIPSPAQALFQLISDAAIFSRCSVLVDASTNWWCETLANILLRKASLSGWRGFIEVGGSWGFMLTSAKRTIQFSMLCSMNTIYATTNHSFVHILRL